MPGRQKKLTHKDIWSILLVCDSSLFLKSRIYSHPILIAGFEGWPNAGCISSDVLSFLKKGLGVKKFAEVNPDIFHKYSNNRPYAKIDGGEVKYLLFSPYEFFYKKELQFARI